MNHLSGADSMFLHMETPEMPMHVGSLNVLDLPPGYEGNFFEDAKTHLLGRMHLADVYTRKLALMPFDLSNPVWVEDDNVDLDYHIRHITLPKPGSNTQLQKLVARLHSSLLDRSRPLWEFYIIDGLRSGQVAFYSKVHHAGIDGQAGVALATSMFDTEATGRKIKPARKRPRNNQYQLGMAELAGAALRNTAVQAFKLVKMTPEIFRAAKSVLIPEKNADGKRDWSLPKTINPFAPRTLLNVSITNQRSFAARTVPLAEVKQIAKLTGVSLNDVVVGTVAGGLRKYLKELDDLPVKSMSAAVPVSLREAGDSTANNQVSMILMTLASDEPDPLKRLQKINASSASSKSKMSRLKAVMALDFPMVAAPWLMSGLSSIVGRSKLVDIVPPIANVLISNVAGIPVQLYFAGAAVVSYYPVSIPAHGMALNVTVQSYNGRLDYGLISCQRAVPDIHELADYLLAEHRLLLELALAQAPAPAAAAVTTAGTADKPRRSKTSAKKSAVRPDVRAIKPAVIPVKRATPAKATRPALVSSQA